MAVAVSEFGFLGGSIGVAAAQRVARAVERATAERLPLIAAPASGGTRMIRAAATDIVRICEGGLILALARIDGRPCVLAGQDRTALPHGPQTLRTARRGMRLAADLRLPLVTIIDTPGGELSPQPRKRA